MYQQRKRSCSTLRDCRLAWEKTSTFHSPVANASPRYEENLNPVAVSRVDLVLDSGSSKVTDALVDVSSSKLTLLHSIRGLAVEYSQGGCAQGCEDASFPEAESVRKMFLVAPTSLLGSMMDQ